jgi:predicted XRE-type DNA-binding protein
MSSAKGIDHSGSTFDSFLQEENLLDDAEAVAMKRVIAWQLQEAMKARRITKKRMATDMKTSRSQIDRLLDPGYVGISLETVSKAASVLGKRLQVQFVDTFSGKQRSSGKVRTAHQGRKRNTRKGKELPISAAG